MTQPNRSPLLALAPGNIIYMSMWGHACMAIYKTYTHMTVTQGQHVQHNDIIVEMLISNKFDFYLA